MPHDHLAREELDQRADARLVLRDLALQGLRPPEERPVRRTVLRVMLEDAVEASKLFDELMGDEVEPRRLFIEKNAKYVSNLDV